VSAKTPMHYCRKAAGDRDDSATDLFEAMVTCRWYRIRSCIDPFPQGTAKWVDLDPPIVDKYGYIHPTNPTVGLVSKHSYRTY